MALVRIPFIGLIFRPFVEQEISRECLLGLLKQINPERNFDGELMVFGAMNTRNIEARYEFLIKGGYKGPSSGEEADMAFSFDGYLQDPPSWLHTTEVRFFDDKIPAVTAHKFTNSQVYQLVDFHGDYHGVKGYECDWEPFIGKING